MAYYQGTNYGQPTQYGAMSTAAVPLSSGMASGSALTQAPSSSINRSGGGLSSINESAAANINEYNPYSTMTAQGDYLRNSGISNFNSLRGQYGQGDQSWVPWQMQAESAGGYGADPTKAGNMFLPGGGLEMTQAGQKAMSGGPNSVYGYQDIYRNPYSGNVDRYGSTNFVGSRGTEDASNYMSQLWAPGQGEAQGADNYALVDNYFNSLYDPAISQYNSQKANPWSQGYSDIDKGQLMRTDISRAQLGPQRTRDGRVDQYDYQWNKLAKQYGVNPSQVKQTSGSGGLSSGKYR